MTKTVYDALADIQAKIAVPKDRKNDFGGYSFRKAEDIIRAARAAAPQGAIIKTSDRIEEIGGQIFVIATAALIYAGETVTADAGAMHSLTKKGMDASQITGSASSYARKYALQGLFALDDGEHDPDVRDNRQENGNDLPQFDAAAAGKRIMASIANATNDLDLTDIWKREADTIKQIGGAGKAKIIDTFKARKHALTQSEAA